MCGRLLRAAMLVRDEPDLLLDSCYWDTENKYFRYLIKHPTFPGSNRKGWWYCRTSTDADIPDDLKSILWSRPCKQCTNEMWRTNPYECECKSGALMRTVGTPPLQQINYNCRDDPFTATIEDGVPVPQMTVSGTVSSTSTPTQTTPLIVNPAQTGTPNVVSSETGNQPNGDSISSSTIKEPDNAIKYNPTSSGSSINARWELGIISMIIILNI